MPTLRDLRPAFALAESQDGVLSRPQLVELGISRWVTMQQIESRRWRSHGRWTVAVHTGQLGLVAQAWRSIFEVRRGAAIDGLSALILAGLKNIDCDVWHLSITSGQRSPNVDGVRVHHVSRRAANELTASGCPRSRPAIAAIRAAAWAASDRQAALFLVAPVQQRLLLPSHLDTAFAIAPTRERRALIVRLIADVTNGVQALGELDFAAECVRWGLPRPSHQLVRTRPDGTAYLDGGWEDINLAFEIDGAQHFVGTAPVDDALRQNDLVIDGDRIIRIPLLGWRIAKDKFMRQVVRAYHRARLAAAA